MKLIFTLLLLIFSLSFFAQEGTTVHEKDGKFGIERHGEQLIPIDYDGVIALGGCDEVYFAIQKGNKWALWIYEEQATDFVFDEVYKYSDFFDIKYQNAQIAVVKEGEYYGIIKINDCSSAPYVLAPKYISIEYQSFNDYEMYIIATDNNGNIEFYLTDDYFEDIIINETLSGYKSFTLLENSEQLTAIVQKEKNGKYGLVGNDYMIIPCEYDKLEPIYTQGEGGSLIYYVKVWKDDKVNLIYIADGEGIELFPSFVNQFAFYTKGYDFNYNLAFEDNGQWNIIHNAYDYPYQANTNYESRAYQTVIGFDSIVINSLEFMWVKSGDNWALYSADVFLTPFRYKKPFNLKRRKKISRHLNQHIDKPEKFYKQTQLNNGRYILESNDKYGFIQDDMLTPPVYDSVVPLHDYGFLVQKNERWGIAVYYEQSKIIYDNIQWLPEIDSNLYKLSIGDKHSIWNPMNSIKTDLVFDSVDILNQYQLITWQDGLAGAMGESKDNLLPTYNKIEFPKDKMIPVIAWTDDSLQIMYDRENASSQRYSEWAKSNSGLDIFYVKDKNGWQISKAWGSYGLGNFSDIESLEKASWKRYDKWEKALKESGIIKGQIASNIWALKSPEGNQLVYASRDEASKNEKWMYPIYKEPVDSFFETKVSSYFIVLKDGLYGFAGKSISNDEEAYHIQYKNIVQDDSTYTFFIYNTENKIALFNPYRTQYKKIIFYDVIQQMQSVKGLWKVKLGDAYGLELLDSRTSGNAIQIDCKYEDIYYLNHYSSYYSKWYFAFKLDGKWGVISYDSYENTINIVEEAKFETIEKAAKAAKIKL